MTKKTAKTDKYALYEHAVQSPEVHIQWFNRISEELLGRKPHSLREDFCGTFLISREWVASHPKNTALALDLDPAPLAYGLKRLKPRIRQRVKVLRKNVLSVTRPGVDVIAACNFSFCIFKERKVLVDYFRKCHRSLGKGSKKTATGALILELAGGPGMIQPMRERRRVRDFGPPFIYTWHQKSFDPVSQNGQYAIHFQFDDGTRLMNAFTYDWRLWNIPELREALMEAGFQETAVYWETEHRGEPTGEFIHAEHGDNAFAWIAYIVGIKKPE